MEEAELGFLGRWIGCGCDGGGGGGGVGFGYSAAPPIILPVLDGIFSDCIVGIDCVGVTRNCLPGEGVLGTWVLARPGWSEEKSDWGNGDVGPGECDE